MASTGCGLAVGDNGSERSESWASCNPLLFLLPSLRPLLLLRTFPADAVPTSSNKLQHFSRYGAHGSLSDRFRAREVRAGNCFIPFAVIQGPGERPSMKQSKGWRIFRPKEKEDVEEIAEPDSRNEYLADLAARWADHRFTAADGRRFAYIQGSDSILNRAQILGLFLTRRERALLEKGSLVGAIVEFGSIEPMVYGDFDTLKSDWLELHRSFNEPLTEEESIAFDVIQAIEYEDEDGDSDDQDIPDWDLQDS